jgi:hypothetical protein
MTLMRSYVNQAIELLRLGEPLCVDSKRLKHNEPIAIAIYAHITDE